MLIKVKRGVVFINGRKRLKEIGMAEAILKNHCLAKNPPYMTVKVNKAPGSQNWETEAFSHTLNHFVEYVWITRKPNTKLKLKHSVQVGILQTRYNSRHHKKTA